MNRSNPVSALEAAVPTKLRRFLEQPKIREAFDARAELIALGASIREKRKAAGLTQSEFAELIGGTQPDIVRIEKGLGKHGPTLQTLLRVGDALNSRVVITFESLPVAGNKSTKPHESLLEIKDLDVAATASYLVTP